MSPGACRAVRILLGTAQHLGITWEMGMLPLVSSHYCQSWACCMCTQHQSPLEVKLAILICRPCCAPVSPFLAQNSTRTPPPVLTLSCMGAGTKRQQVTEGRLLSYMTTPAGSADSLLSGKSGLRASMFQLDLPAEQTKSVASSMPQGLQRPGHANGAAQDSKAPDGLKVLRFASACGSGIITPPFKVIGRSSCSRLASMRHEHLIGKAWAVYTTCQL